MKSLAEIKDAHNLFGALISGQWPIVFKKQDLRVLEAQFHVLCWVLECERNDCFKNSINSLKDLIGHIRFCEEGRKFKSQVLAE